MLILVDKVLNCFKRNFKVITQMYSTYRQIQQQYFFVEPKVLYLTEYVSDYIL